MDYNKIIISLVIILLVFTVGGFVLLNQHNPIANTVVVENNTSSSINVEKINSEDVVNPNSGDSQ